MHISVGQDSNPNQPGQRADSLKKERRIGSFTPPFHFVVTAGKSPNPFVPLPLLPQGEYLSLFLKGVTALGFVGDNHHHYCYRTTNPPLTMSHPTPVCDTFVPQKWQKNKCATCMHWEEKHGKGKKAAPKPTAKAKAKAPSSTSMKGAKTTVWNCKVCAKACKKSPLAICPSCKHPKFDHTVRYCIVLHCIGCMYVCRHARLSCQFFFLLFYFFAFIFLPFGRLRKHQ